MPKPREAPSLWLALLGLLALAFLLRWGLALLLPNIYRPDEIFQTLEPAFRMWSGGGIVTWEWRAGIRSPLFPGFLAGLIACSSWLGLTASGYLAVIAAFLSLVASGSVAVGFLAGWRRAGWIGALVCGVICACWPDLVYFGPKPLTEIQAGNLLIIAAYLASTSAPAGHEPVWRKMDGRLVIAGLLLGLVFSIRFHLVAGVLLVILWSAYRDRRRSLSLIAAFAGVVVVSGLIDFFYWGGLFQSVLRNYEINIGEGVSRHWGAMPVYWYLGGFIEEWGAATIPLAAALAVGARRAPFYALLALAILASHELVAHKEMSFVYAALPPALIVAGLGSLDIARFLVGSGRAMPDRALAAAIVALWSAIAATTLLSGAFRPYWTGDRQILQAEAALRGRPALCGVGLRGPRVTWWHSGGDVFLGRPVPIYAFTTKTAGEVTPAINAAIGDRDVVEGLAGFEIEKCWEDAAGDICLARIERPSGCVPDLSLDVNSERVLQR